LAGVAAATASSLPAAASVRKAGPVPLGVPASKVGALTVNMTGEQI
jgi:hypothetical protein